MAPLLILFFGVSPTIAVGTDLVYNGITKIFGSWQHWRQKTIDFRSVRWMAVTSIPGAIMGVAVLTYFKNLFALDSFNKYFEFFLGGTFVIVSIIMALNSLVKKKEPLVKIRKRNLMGIGLVGGFLVGLTSIGSGSLFIALLSSIGGLSGPILIGTDIAHAAILALSSGISHALYGTVDLRIAIFLLVGSIPGIIIGSKLTLILPIRLLKSFLALILLLSGIKLMWN